MNNNHKTVAIYARVSTDRQAVDMQLDDRTEYIKRRGWILYNITGNLQYYERSMAMKQKKNV